ncbi:MAG: MarR family transcriptional regulator [Christiangramia sp.]
MDNDYLKLENQLCFPIYAASRLITRAYQPFLENLKITYPQYLVLLVLWEKDEISVNDIANKLILNTNTITPLLKRMEEQRLICRERSKSDERKVIVKLTKKGLHLKEEAKTIPEEIAETIKGVELEIDHYVQLKHNLNLIIAQLSNK